ncbi:MAG: tetratricopeptide repeat protein, partial [Candidatus Omnitrophica bacterium]|nr:tetratricopeptide repeat protein [Candidatus Omnitrophota bacterium]
DKEIGEGLRRGGAIYKAEEAAKGIRAVRKARYSELAPAAEPEAPVALDASRADEGAALEHIAALSLKESKSEQRLARSAPASSGLAAGIPILGDMFGGGMYGGYAGRPLSQITAMVRDEFPLTAYFNGSVVTDEDGRATLRVKLPDSLTTWEAAAIAITQDALVDQSKQNIAVDKPYRVEIETPAFLTEGDQSSAMAVIRNNTEKDRQTQSTFIQVSGDQEKTYRWEDSLPSGDVQKREIPLSARRIGDSSVTLQSAGGDLQDALSRTISIVPWGIPVRSGKSSIAAQSVVEKISLPSEADYSRRSMWITIGGGADLSLISPVWTQPIAAYSNRAQIEKGLAALAAMDCVEALNKTDQAPMNILHQEVESAARHAITVQSNDGFWSWGGGKNGRIDFITTARASELLRKAKDRGLSVPDQILEKTAQRLVEAYQKTAQDNEKTRILYAWSCIQPPDFSFVNRIHRGIARLDAFDAALLGLTWFNMGRMEKAQEALQYLFAAQEAPARTPQSSSPLNRIQSAASPYDITAAMAFLYFQLPSSARTEKQTQSFLEKLAPDAAGNPMIQSDAYGWKMQALASYLTAAAEEDQSFSLVVKVNDQEVCRQRAAQSVFPYRRIDIDPEWIKDGENRIEFIYAGKGKYRYSTVLEGWTRQDVRPQNWIEPQDRIIRQVEREYTHGPLTVAHKEIPRGYSVIEETAPSITNVLEEVPAGERINIRLWMHGRDQLDHVIVEEPIPAGFLLEQNSIRGPVDHYFLQKNKLVLYLRGPQNYYAVDYQLRARFPGKYRAAPARISAYEAPGQIYATSSQSITVLPKGEQPKIPYKPTPDELYYMGLRYFEIGEFDAAREYLTTLIDSYTLRAEVYLEAARKLFLIHLKGDNAGELVRYFEIIKERDADFEVQFEQIARLGRAYRQIGEYERAVYVYQSLFDGLFLQESALSGTLQEVKRHRESLDAMKQLILEYPDIPSVQNAVYTAGSIIFQNVDDWAQEEDFILAGHSVKSLLSEAVGMINSFLALYPNNPMADEAGYTLINLWLDQRNFAHVSELAESFARRYPKSLYLDSFDYLCAYALFQLERYDEALQLAKKVSETEYPAPGGGVRKSEEANAAILMAGKILHAAGNLDQALEEYNRVKEAFGDAGKSIEFLTQKGLKVDDLSIFRMGDPASVSIEYKNLDQIELRIYQVDLMTFYLTERNLEGMTGIDLAGITPAIQKTYDIQEEKRFVWNEIQCDLSLPDPGAYLAVASGGGLQSSSMILRSDLEIEVQEDAEQGLVRVNVREGKDGRGVKGVKIQVRGSENERFASGESDLRGVFTAAGVRGAATVLAQAGDQYGFWRGERRLGGPAGGDASGRGRVQGLQEGRGQALYFDALYSNASRLGVVQEEQSRRWADQVDPTNNRLRSQRVRSFR